MPKTTITTRNSIIRETIGGIGIDTVARRKVVSLLLRQKGIPYRAIGKALGVSCTCIYQYVYPDRVNDSNRITQLSTIVNGKRVVITGPHKREYTKRCELCDKLPKSKLYYHHWLDDFPNVGMWLCYKCHVFAEAIDEKRKLIDTYIQLKNKITIECLKELEQ